MADLWSRSRFTAGDDAEIGDYGYLTGDMKGERFVRLGCIDDLMEGAVSVEHSYSTQTCQRRATSWVKIEKPGSVLRYVGYRYATFPQHSYCT